MKLAIFTTSTDNIYAVYAIVGMLSYKQCYPDADVFIAGNFQEETGDLIRSCGLAVLPIDLSEVFPMRKNAPYPSECMWWIGVPQSLAHLGYTHSIYADPDTYCVKAIPQSAWRQIIHVAGQPMNTVTQMLENSDARRCKLHIGAKKVTEVLDLNTERATQQRRQLGRGVIHVNSGVLLFNHSGIESFGLLQKAKGLMSRIRAADQYWDGDDSFLALLALTHPQFHLHQIPRLQYIHERVKGRMPAFFIVHIDGTRGTRKPWLQSQKSDILHQHVLKWQAIIQEIPQLHPYFTHLITTEQH